MVVSVGTKSAVTAYVPAVVFDAVPPDGNTGNEYIEIWKKKPHKLRGCRGCFREAPYKMQGPQTGKRDVFKGGEAGTPYKKTGSGRIKRKGNRLTFIVPLRDTQAQTVAARTNSTAIVVRPTATNAPPTNNEAVVFPPLKLQGLSYRRTNPSVIINGRTYFVGNYIGDVKVVSIDEEQAVIELNGNFKVLELGK